MKKVIFFVSLISAFIFILENPLPSFARTNNVEVCHIPPGNSDNFHTLVVRENALPAHLAHGDWAGPCDPTLMCDDGDPCTTDVDPYTDKCIDGNRPTVDCDDDNLCTSDSCDSTMGCINEPVVCDDHDECTTSICNPGDGTCVDSAVVCNEGEVCEIGVGCVSDTLSNCVEVNGLTWCFNINECGEACNAVCASQGLTPIASNQEWFEAQDELAECQAISQALGLGTDVIFGHPFSFACLEDSGSKSDGLQGPLLCSTFRGCPSNHRTEMDSQGVACDTTISRRSICPCE